ncbi:MAG: peptide chain release factor N(5)-glutamine methyltransferase [Propionibacteriaceae bacterium]|nr:peptide chain release factor N(5)-glutamine methyltransferase [Propionibacteriaceae bacterium]
MTTPAQAVTAVATALTRAGVASAPAEARILVGFALGVDPSRLILAPVLTADQQAHIDRLVAERLGGSPLQHVTGQAHFRTVSVRVGPGVFIPRPETELLAGWAVAQVAAGARRVVELCAGSGAISLAVATESAPEEHWAVEVSDVAYAYLVSNLAGTGVHTVHADMAHALGDLDSTIDVVVANPPYIPLSDRDSLPRDVHQDPDLALYSGDDGLIHTRVVADVASRLLRPGGVVGSEHGDDQADDVCRVFALAGFTDITAHADLASRPRFVTAKKPDVK